ncbi:hypothetical protein KKP97_04210 [Methanothermococcus sp. SCGC AD-155-C09]|nr:hypothetical protein [Methanothermococcus sp. SCGC AD-155-C09]
MNPVKKYIKEIDRIRELIKPIVDEHYPSKANKEVMSLYDLITFGILAHLHFNGVIKHAYTHFIEDLELFPKIRYNKLIERLNRYEELLYKVLDYVFKKISEGEVKIVDAKPVETKELIRSNRHKKRGESKIIREEESVGYTPSKKKDVIMVVR